jgi:hypothetical protein
VDAASDAWRSITSFDEQGRRRLFAAVVDFAHSILAHPWLLCATATLALLAWRRKRAAIPAPVRELSTAMQRAGVRLLPGETPREMLTRTATVPMQEARRARLVAAVRSHEAKRYLAKTPARA